MGGGGMGGMMGGGMEEAEAEVPSVVKEKYAKFWWVCCVLMASVAIMDVFAADIFGVLFMGLMTFTVWYMVSNNCKNMTQYCLMLFGTMCLIQSVFDLITLLTMLGGRTVSNRTVTSSLSPDGTSQTQNIVINQEKHSFFDSTMGLTYNVQSAVRIASPATMALSALLAYWTYSAYPLGLFEAASQGDETGNFAQNPRMARGGFGGYGGQGMGGGGGGGRTIIQGGVVQGPQGGGAAPRPSGALWEGTGQRLGSA